METVLDRTRSQLWYLLLLQLGFSVAYEIHPTDNNPIYRAYQVLELIALAVAVWKMYRRGLPSVLIYVVEVSNVVGGLATTAHNHTWWVLPLFWIQVSIAARAYALQNPQRPSGVVGRCAVWIVKWPSDPRSNLWKLTLLGFEACALLVVLAVALAAFDPKVHYSAAESISLIVTSVSLGGIAHLCLVRRPIPGQQRPHPSRAELFDAIADADDS